MFSALRSNCPLCSLHGQQHQHPENQTLPHRQGLPSRPAHYQQGTLPIVLPVRLRYRRQVRCHDPRCRGSRHHAGNPRSTHRQRFPSQGQSQEDIRSRHPLSRLQRTALQTYLFQYRQVRQTALELSPC